MNTSEEKKMPIDLLPCTNPGVSSLFWGMIIGICFTIVLEIPEVKDASGPIFPFLATLCALPGLLFIWNFSKACRALRHGIANLGYAIVYLDVANILYDLIFQNADEKSVLIAEGLFLLVFTILSVWVGILIKNNYEGEMGELGNALIKFPFIIILVIILIFALGAKGGAKLWIRVVIGLIYLCYFLYVKVLKRMYNLLNDGLEMAERDPEVADLFNRDDLKVALIDGVVGYIADSDEKSLNFNTQSAEINLENNPKSIDNPSEVIPPSVKEEQPSLITDVDTKKKKWYYVWGGASIIAIGVIIYLVCSGLGKGDPVTMTQLHGCWIQNQEENNSSAYSIIHFNARERTFREDFTYSEDGQYICSFRIMGNWSATKDEIRMKYDMESLRFAFNPGLGVEDRKEIRNNVKDEIKKDGISKEKIISIDSDNLETIDKDGDKIKYFRDYEAY
ncbi:MAG: hypothetical protein HDS28_01140 [Bacteroides sp.]|nr:hypothetical protein [Bacteroides sp.]